VRELALGCASRASRRCGARARAAPRALLAARRWGRASCANLRAVLPARRQRVGGVAAGRCCGGRHAQELFLPQAPHDDARWSATDAARAGGRSLAWRGLCPARAGWTIALQSCCPRPRRRHVVERASAHGCSARPASRAASFKTTSPSSKLRQRRLPRCSGSEMSLLSLPSSTCAAAGPSRASRARTRARTAPCRRSGISAPFLEHSLRMTCSRKSSHSRVPPQWQPSLRLVSSIACARRARARAATAARRGSGLCASPRA
jgi:hypothetical protein